jgi:hypothetical protein
LEEDKGEGADGRGAAGEGLKRDGKRDSHNVGAVRQRLCHLYDLGSTQIVEEMRRASGRSDSLLGADSSPFFTLVTLSALRRLSAASPRPPIAFPFGARELDFSCLPNNQVGTHAARRGL